MAYFSAADFFAEEFDTGPGAESIPPRKITGNAGIGFVRSKVKRRLYNRKK